MKPLQAAQRISDSECVARRRFAAGDAGRGGAGAQWAVGGEPLWGAGALHGRLPRRRRRRGRVAAPQAADAPLRSRRPPGSRAPAALQRALHRRTGLACLNPLSAVSQNILCGPCHTAPVLTMLSPAVPPGQTPLSGQGCLITQVKDNFLG